jgi:GT2 family glycosyltransferase
MQAIRRTGAELVLFLDRPGRFHRLAVAALALALHRNAEAFACYGDHDLVDAAGHREAPVFKPAWSPDYLASCNYIGQPVAFRGDPAFFETLGSAISLACPTFSLLMRRAAAASAAPIAHVPRVLFHQRREGSLASLDARTTEEGRIVAAACGAGATVMAEPGAAWRRVRHLTGATPLAVSVICPSKDNPELLRRACDSVLRAEGVSVRLVIVDNGAGTEAQRSLLAELARLANVRVLPAPGPFNFSRLINQGRAAADGDVLVLLNDDVEATEPEWLTELASQAARPEIGCVGALLLYPDRRIQHAGVTLGFFGGAAHAFRYWPEQAEDEALRLKSVHEVAAVTAACLAVRASVFDEAGGFSEDLAVALNDVDFCLKVCSLGYRNIVTPHARLVHHESASRGLDSTPEKWRRFSREAALFRRRWGEAALRDPYVSQHCSLAHDDYRPRRL